MTRLRQLPLFYPPALERTVRALHPSLRILAEELHRHVAGDGRSWLEVLAAAAELEHVALDLVIGGSLVHRAVRARRATWCALVDDGTSRRAVARAWQVCAPTVERGLVAHRTRAAATAEQHQAVEAHVAGELAERAA